MNKTLQKTFDDLSPFNAVDKEIGKSSLESKMVNVLTKALLAFLGLGVGGFVGIYIAFSIGLVSC